MYTPWPPLAVALFTLARIRAGFSGVLGATLEKTVTPDPILGRVGSFTASASTLTLPVGALIGGLVASRIGTLSTMAVAGLLLGFVSLFYAVRPRLCRLPAVDGIDSAEYNI